MTELTGWVVAAAFCAVLLAAPARAQDQSGPSLLEKSQNPIANLISVPIQENVFFNVGELDRTSSQTLLQPVYPAHLTDDWNLIIRPILPIVYQPALFKGDSSDFGLGDLNPQLFLSPSKTYDTPVGTASWGVGPAFQIPTATSGSLGTGKWSAGPSGVVFLVAKPWTYGALVQNYFSFAGRDDKPDVNEFVLQPFVNYNLEAGWFLSTNPIIVADWEADDRKWTLPLGGGFGKLFKIGDQPVNAAIRSYYNLLSPVDGPDWQIQAQLTFLFPE